MGARPEFARVCTSRPHPLPGKPPPRQARSVEKFTVELATGDAQGVLPQAQVAKVEVTYYKDKQKGSKAGCVPATFLV